MEAPIAIDITIDIDGIRACVRGVRGVGAGGLGEAGRTCLGMCVDGWTKSRGYDRRVWSDGRAR